MGRRCVVGLLLVGLLAACTGGGGRTDEPDGASTTDVPVTSHGTPVTPGSHDPQPAAVGLRLSEGHAAVPPAELSTLVDGRALTPDEIDAVLARLPEWSAP